MKCKESSGLRTNRTKERPNLFYALLVPRAAVIQGVLSLIGRIPALKSRTSLDKDGSSNFARTSLNFSSLAQPFARDGKQSHSGTVMPIMQAECAIRRAGAAVSDQHRRRDAE
jgi:hypothetical protein